MKKSEKNKRDAKRDGARAQGATPPNIQVVFVDPNGTTTSGPLIVLPQKSVRRPTFNDAAWTQDQTISRFYKYLRNGNGAGLEATVRALNRLDCWPQAVDQLMTGYSPNIPTGRALLSFWNTYGLYSIPRGLRENMPLLVDAFRYLLPPYTGKGLTLYRGELESRHVRGIYGISWTPNLDKAKEFANRRSPDEGHGVVLRLDAIPKLIVAALRHYSPHTLTLGEDEYLLDPRLIRSKISVLQD